MAILDKKGEKNIMDKKQFEIVLNPSVYENYILSCNNCGKSLSGKEASDDTEEYQNFIDELYNTEYMDCVTVNHTFVAEEKYCPYCKSNTFNFTGRIKML